MCKEILFVLSWIYLSKALFLQICCFFSILWKHLYTFYMNLCIYWMLTFNA